MLTTLLVEVRPGYAPVVAYARAIVPHDPETDPDEVRARARIIARIVTRLAMEQLGYCPKET